MNQTGLAYLLTRILDTPFWGLFNLIPIILYKDLKATAFQLGLVITLKPLVSIFSSYWSSKALQLPRGLQLSLFYGRLLAYLPFFALPWIHSSWYLIFCFGFYLFLQMGMMPAWTELLNQNLKPPARDKLFSYAQSFGYLGGGLLSFAIGWMLDQWFLAWVWIFPLAAILGLSAIFWQRKILTLQQKHEVIKDPSHSLIQPWKNSWELLKRRKDFAKFQIGFMWSGAGLMIIQPTLPVFFVDTLHLSYTAMGLAIMLCKGVGFALSTPFWVSSIQRINFFSFCAFTAVLGILFTALIVAAETSIVWLYLAYLVYGFMQSGNELSWNMSGPIFAKKEDSSPYSTVNVIAIGLRGVFIPSLGAFWVAQFGSLSALLLSALFCSVSALTMLYFSRNHEVYSYQEAN